MAPRTPPQTTTEEHRPASADEPTDSRPALLAAFPAQALVPLPASGTIVGRSWLADAGLADTKVSSGHLRFTRAGGRLQVEDVGSRNGTWVQGQKLPQGERVPLQDGAVLRIGGTLLVYREGYAGPAQPEPPLGALAGPWGLGAARAALRAIRGSSLRNVLIEGESGTGKELVATEVVRALGRPEQRFARLNVAGVPAGVFEGQLFGWVRGAFSGGAESSEGTLRAHNGGAVMLDEIGELPLELQPKLLRFLESQEVQPVGAPRPVKVDVVVIAATNRVLEDAVREGRFRLDLLARFPVRIALPALGDRPEDVYAIAAALWERTHGRLDPGRTPVEVEAVEQMMLHDWPENVRGVARLLAATQPATGLTLALVRRELGVRAAAAKPAPTREAILAALKECGDNRTRAAERLGLSRPQLLRLLKAMQEGGAKGGGGRAHQA